MFKKFFVPFLFVVIFNFNDAFSAPHYEMGDSNISTNTNWLEGEYSMNSLTVSNGATLTIDAASTISVTGTLHIEGNSKIVLKSKDAAGQIDGQWQGSGVTINAGNITIETGSKISADGQGYVGGVGPGVGNPDDYMHAGSGGGYGGQGGNSGGSSQGGGIGGLTYGSSTMPIELGSGGGSAGGSGGGNIRLNVSGTLTLNGVISANGNSGTNTPCGPGAGGGGSGGSILVTVGTLTGNGSFTANGGAGGIGGCTGTGDNGGGGGGGQDSRILRLRAVL